MTETEAACLMKVLSKPELDNSVILNEFVLIMENFGIPVSTDEDEYANDYEQDSVIEEPEENSKKPEERSRLKMKKKPKMEIKFEILDEKGNKILKKLARFLLERFMHPREFFGPTIKKEIIGKKKCVVEVIKHHDFYLRLKLASIRKKLKENISLNQFLAIDGEKYPGFMQVRRLIKSLEILAESEQEHLAVEQEAKERERKLKMEEDAREITEKGINTTDDDYKLE